jgi:hypothetical protein
LGTVLFSLSSATYSVGEGDGVVNVVVKRTGSGVGDVSVHYATSDGTATTADSDYVAASGTLTFAPGETTKTIDVAIDGDVVHEYDETFDVALTSPVQATIADGTGVGTVADDDAPHASIDDVAVREGNAGPTTATFTVTLTAPPSVSTSVDWATQDGSAVAGSDYEAASGTLTFAPGETTKTVAVTVDGDIQPEPNEGFEVDLSNPVATVIDDGVGAGTIQNDDVAATALTLKVVKSRAKVSAKGLLEPATSGLQVTVGLYRKLGRHYKRLSKRVVAVKSVLDRDSDGQAEGAYAAAFKRPPKGAYMVKATFAGNAQFKPTSKAVKVKL